MKKLIFLLFLTFNFIIFSQELEMKKIESILIINFEKDNSPVFLEKKSLFYGIDVDRLLKEASEGTGRYSKEAKLATKLTKLELRNKRLFDVEELERILNESSAKTNEKLKNDIRALYITDDEYKMLVPKK